MATDVRVLVSGIQLDWAGLQRLALYNPPGSACDDYGGMFWAGPGLPGEVDLQVGADRLFGAIANPYRVSLLDFALGMLRVAHGLRTSSNDRRLAFRPSDNDWELRFDRQGSTVEISATYQAPRPLRCSTEHLLAALDDFLDRFVLRLFVRAPLALEWRRLAPLRVHLEERMSSVPPSDHGAAACAFVWSADQIDWDEVKERRRLNPPGSSFDQYGDVARELFGAPLTITRYGEPIAIRVQLHAWYKWQPIQQRRRELGREAGTVPYLDDDEPRPLLALGLHLARSLRRPRGRGDAAADAGMPEGGWTDVPGLRAYHPVLAAAFIDELEDAVGAPALRDAARTFLGEFVRAVHAHGDGAAAWNTLRSIRPFAF